MNTLVRTSDAASLALHSMVLLAANSERLASTGEIAARLRASEAHLSKVLQRLAKAGLIVSTRGPKGGYALAKSLDTITLLDVYEAIDGALASSRCLLRTPICTGGKCIFGDLLATVNSQIRQYLAQTTLDELTAVYGDEDGHPKADNQH